MTNLEIKIKNARDLWWLHNCCNDVTIEDVAEMVTYDEELEERNAIIEDLEFFDLSSLGY